MNWNLLGQIAAILIIKLISSSLFLLYSSQIFQKGPAVVYRHKNSCRLGWELYEGNCYSFSVVEKTWDESQQSCASLNSSLAVVNNREELMFLKKRTEGVNYFFIGLTKKGSGGQWKWIDNTVYDPDINGSRSAWLNGGNQKDSLRRAGRSETEALNFPSGNSPGKLADAQRLLLLWNTMRIRSFSCYLTCCLI
ncbi:C-type lectin domain family 5 member A-like isoform X1 [Pogona vitticeps]